MTETLDESPGFDYRDAEDAELPEPELDPEDEPVFDPDFNEVDVRPPTADQSLRYFGADFDVVGLIRRLRDKELIIPTFDPEVSDETGYAGFQRRFVWPKGQMDRFVESLLLGYPVPGIFLVELPNRKYLVLDGQQRLRTLRAFYDGKYGVPPNEKIFRLQRVGAEFQGKTYETLLEADRRLLDNTFIQATIVVPKDESRDAVYRLFERINSSGIKLQPQEIRVALYSGKFIEMLRDMNGNDAWRLLFGRRHSRLKDHELILRYLALTESALLLRQHGWDRSEARKAEAAEGVPLAKSRVYRPPMSSFLNHYMDRHVAMQGVDRDAVVAEFDTISRALLAAGGAETLRVGGTQVNAAHTDAVLVGSTLALRDGGSLAKEQVSAALEALTSNNEYNEAISGSTSHTDSVVNRLRLAAEAFAES